MSTPFSHFYSRNLVSIINIKYMENRKCLPHRFSLSHKRFPSSTIHLRTKGKDARLLITGMVFCLLPLLLSGLRTFLLPKDRRWFCGARHPPLDGALDRAVSPRHSEAYKRIISLSEDHRSPLYRSSFTHRTRSFTYILPDRLKGVPSNIVSLLR